MRHIELLAFAATLFPLVLPATAQSRFATQVISFNQGPGASPSFSDPSRLLGGPRGFGLGAGSLDVLSLGEGGDVVLGFDVTIVDGPGADLTVSENGFVIGSGPSVFAEILFVEVSTDGNVFARFPTRYVGSGSVMGSLRGLAGGLPVLANVDTNSISPFDPVVSGGEAFDLADLALDPLVQSGAVDLRAIHFVRLVDVLPGQPDSFGTPLPGSGGSDVDSVAVLNADVDNLAAKPVCDLELDPALGIVLTIGDPQGIGDLDFNTLHASFDLAGFPADVLLQASRLQSVTGTEVVLAIGPIPSGYVSALAFSIADRTGLVCGDQVLIQG